MRFEHFQAALKSARIRMTVQRKVILAVLAQATDHPDAAEIHRRAASQDKAISLSTVYRTLRMLEGGGAILRHAFEDGRSRFENTGGEHHDHLIDMDTGQVIEFRSDRIERLQAEIASRLGYAIVRHKLVIYGQKKR